MATRDLIGISGRPAPVRAAKHAGDDYGATAQPDWREIDWREHLRQAQVGGRRMTYVDMGESRDQPAVVFIHGLGGCWQNWLENIPRIAQERRVIAMDLPGFSQSEMPAQKISVSGYAGAVDDLCDQLGLGPAVFVGNSMGGFVAAELGINHAGRCDRIALVSAAGISITNLRRRPVITSARITAAVTEMVIARRARMVKRPGLRHAMLGYVARHPTRLKPELVYEIMTGTGSPGFIKALEALTDYDFRDRLQEIKAPTLLVWGKNDNLVPVEDADEFERLIPNARKVILEDTGHIPMVERPETFNDLLLEFLAEEPSENAPQQVAEETGAAA